MNDVVISISTEQEVSDMACYIATYHNMLNDGVLRRAGVLLPVPAIFIQLFFPPFRSTTTFRAAGRTWPWRDDDDVYLTMDDGLDGAMDEYGRWIVSSTTRTRGNINSLSRLAISIEK